MRANDAGLWPEEKTEQRCFAQGAMTLAFVVSGRVPLDRGLWLQRRSANREARKHLP